MPNLKQKLLGVALLFALLTTMEANAQQTRNLDVSAVVPEVCVINSAATIPMDFGTLDVVNGGAGPGGDTEQSADFTWRCSAGTAVTVELDLGLGSGASLTKRVMTGTNPANLLPYRLQKTDTSDWGDTASGTAFTTTALGIATAETSQIDGIVTLADAQAAPVDTYSDTVVITLLP